MSEVGYAVFGTMIGLAVPSLNNMLRGRGPGATPWLHLAWAIGGAWSFSKVPAMHAWVIKARHDAYAKFERFRVRHDALTIRYHQKLKEAEEIMAVDPVIISKRANAPPPKPVKYYRDF